MLTRVATPTKRKRITYRGALWRCRWARVNPTWLIRVNLYYFFTSAGNACQRTRIFLAVCVYVWRVPAARWSFVVRVRDLRLMWKLARAISHLCLAVVNVCRAIQIIKDALVKLQFFSIAWLFAQMVKPTEANNLFIESTTTYIIRFCL